MSNLLSLSTLLIGSTFLIYADTPWTPLRAVQMVSISLLALSLKAKRVGIRNTGLFLFGSCTVLSCIGLILWEWLFGILAEALIIAMVISAIMWSITSSNNIYSQIMKRLAAAVTISCILYFTGLLFTDRSQYIQIICANSCLMALSFSLDVINHFESNCLLSKTRIVQFSLLFAAAFPYTCRLCEMFSYGLWFQTDIALVLSQYRNTFVNVAAFGVLAMVHLYGKSRAAKRILDVIPGLFLAWCAYQLMLVSGINDNDLIETLITAATMGPPIVSYVISRAEIPSAGIYAGAITLAVALFMYIFVLLSGNHYSIERLALLLSDSLIMLSVACSKQPKAMKTC